MNDLRQQVAAAATSSSSVNESSSNNLSAVNATAITTALTTAKTLTAAAIQSEEEQRVSSTSSPAQVTGTREQATQSLQQQQQQQQQPQQPLNATAALQNQQQQGERQDDGQQPPYQQEQQQQQQLEPDGEEEEEERATIATQHSSPAQITSTTSSPPQRMRDDETQRQTPTTRQQQQQAAASTGAPPHQQISERADQATTTTAAASAQGRIMVATALDGSGNVNGAAANSVGSDGGSSSSNSSSSGQPMEESGPTTSSHKLILKLSKHTNESQTPAASSNDERRVEPLRIHLSTSTGSTLSSAASSCSSSSSSSTSSSSSCMLTAQQSQQHQQQLQQQLHHQQNQQHQQQVVPKITIRPILRKQNDASDASSCSSSCADDELMSIVTTDSETATPHIVPKLTIRAANEERGVTSVVPKLTIKMTEPQQIGNSETSAFNCNSQAGGGTLTATPPPLPKLTIKTKLSGNSESMISSLSPASSASLSASCASTKPASETQAQTVPKLTIKKQSGEDAVNESVPKLMIKTTHAGSSCISSDEQQILHAVESEQQQQLQQQPISNKIPKLTIKTGQEHTVIMTHDANNAQSIPKLTIKTKSIELDDDNKLMGRMSIKTSDEAPSSSSKSPGIPKLTISVGGSSETGTGRMGPQSPSLSKVMLRHGVCSSVAVSPERSLKLTISRQQQQQDNTDAASAPLPKLTIKASSSGNSLVDSSCYRSADEELERIPKLTIKTVTTEQQQTQLLLDKQQTQHVPKLTIKNLCSPKHKVRVVLEDAKLSSKLSKHLTTPQPGDVQKLPNGIDINETAAALTADEMRRYSDDMDIDDALSKEHDPKMFHNLPSLSSSSNGIVPTAASAMAAAAAAGGGGKPPHNIVEMVDLTSSPSPGSSPAHNSFAQLPAKISAAQSHLVLKCLLMKSAAAAAAATASPSDATAPCEAIGPTSNSSNILHSQLTAPPKAFNIAKAGGNTAVKYPHLAERLMANGSNAALASCEDLKQQQQQLKLSGGEAAVADAPSPSVIDLDTPEGSPQLNHVQIYENEQLNNHMNHSESPQLGTAQDNQINVADNGQQQRLNNNVTAMEGKNRLKRHLYEKAATEQSTERPIESPTSILPTKQRRLDIAESEQQQQQYKQQSNCLEFEKHSGATTEAEATAQSSGSSSSSSSSTNSSPEQQHKQQQSPITSTHRSRKQKHERILNTELDDTLFSATSENQRQQQEQLQQQEQHSHQQASMHAASNTSSNGNIPDIISDVTHEMSATAMAPTKLASKRRGRPKRNFHKNKTLTEECGDADTDMCSHDDLLRHAAKSRRVQLLYKRLAIDMVSAEQPTDIDPSGALAASSPADAAATTTPRRDHRQLRATRRTNAATPTAQLQAAITTPPASGRGGGRKRQRKLVAANAAAATAAGAATDASEHATQLLGNTMEATALSQFGSSLTSASAETNNNMAYALSAQIDLTMCSSSSSTSNGSSMTATLTATASGGAHLTSGSGSAVGGSGGSTMSASMLPPTTILSSSDPLPDVVFQPNDFSSIMATQQLRSPHTSSISGGSHRDSQDEDIYSALYNSGDESMSSGGILTASPMASGTATPTTGRGRGRGRRSRGAFGAAGCGRGSASNNSGSSAAAGASLAGQLGRSGNAAGAVRAPRMSRGASAVAKAIAMSRPRCVGGLKHTPDPERLKGLFSPSPQVFEEDTRMSADLNNSNQSLTSMEPPLTPQKQPDFLNNEESQSSLVSNLSMLDSNQGHSTDAVIGSALKRPKKKKMEICVAEDTEFNASTIAEYDWPPPKGCCPSKNRDTFMIQEQVALYLGITSFKRKYPDLPRRAVDMEERNWLQEKGLVSEKMCDLGITAVWASDILDIMYADFYDKYEEYKEYIRLKHLREIEAKQKALGLSVSTGRGLQARDRAMLSASKWNVYFNKTRKEERVACLDLQTFTMNVPLPRTAPTATRLHRVLAEAVSSAVQAENMPEPPTLLPSRIYDSAFRNSDYAYPLTLVPGQFATPYRVLYPWELKTYPLNTVLNEPLELKERLLLQRMNEMNAPNDEEHSQQLEQLADCEQRQQKMTTDVHKLLMSDSFTPHHDKQQVNVRRSRRARQQLLSDSLEAQQNSDDDKKPDGVPLMQRLSVNTYSASSSSGSSGSSSSGSGSSSSESESDDDNDGNCSTCTCSSASDDEVDSRLPRCGVCLRTQHCNDRNMPESFIRCYTCRRHVHPSCIEMPHRMVGRVRNYNWQCANCKCCIKCKRKHKAGKMLYCEQCDRGYHIYCLGIKTVPDGRWSCERCCICMRCGATKPEGLPQTAQATLNNGEKAKPVKHKKVKWINEYRIDHITKLREHCSMLCVPCARIKPVKRGGSNSSNSNSPGGEQTNGSGINANSTKSPTATGTLTTTSTTGTALMAPPAIGEQSATIANASAASVAATTSSVAIAATVTTSTVSKLQTMQRVTSISSASAHQPTTQPHVHLKPTVLQSSSKAPEPTTNQSSSLNKSSNSSNSSDVATTAAASSSTTTIGIAPPPVVA